MLLGFWSIFFYLKMLFLGFWLIFFYFKKIFLDFDRFSYLIFLGCWSIFYLKVIFPGFWSNFSILMGCLHSVCLPSLCLLKQFFQGRTDILGEKSGGRCGLPRYYLLFSLLVVKDFSCWPQNHIFIYLLFVSYLHASTIPEIQRYFFYLKLLRCYLPISSIWMGFIIFYLFQVWVCASEFKEAKNFKGFAWFSCRHAQMVSWKILALMGAGFGGTFCTWLSGGVGRRWSFFIMWKPNSLCIPRNVQFPVRCDGNSSKRRY